MTCRLLKVALPLCLLTACAPRDTFDDPLCKAVLDALPAGSKGGRACAVASAGVVVGERKEVEGLAPLLDVARGNYVRFFGGSPRRIAFLVGTDLPTTVEQAVERDQALPFNWPSMRGQKAAFVKAMKAEVDTVFASAPPEARKEALAKMVSGFDETVSDDGKPSPLEGGTIQHELAHRWFMDYFDHRPPAGPPPVNVAGRYGSTAPDWLDEAAAIMVENDYLTSSRRHELRKILGSSAPDLVPTLVELMALPHPSTSRPAAEGGGQGIGNITIRVRINNRAAGQERERDVGWFYAMTRAVVDFLIETTADDRVVLRIAEELQGGGSFESWLLKSPHRAALGGDLAGAERRWALWLADRRIARNESSGTPR